MAVPTTQERSTDKLSQIRYDCEDYRPAENGNNGFLWGIKLAEHCKFLLNALEPVLKVTDNRPLGFLAHLESRAKELVPDYPFDGNRNDAFEWLWALAESLKGTSMACDDWYDYCNRLKAAVLVVRPELMELIASVPFRSTDSNHNYKVIRDELRAESNNNPIPN